MKEIGSHQNFRDGQLEQVQQRKHKETHPLGARFSRHILLLDLQIDPPPPHYQTPVMSVTPLNPWTKKKKVLKIKTTNENPKSEVRLLKEIHSSKLTFRSDIHTFSLMILPNAMPRGKTESPVHVLDK